MPGLFGSSQAVSIWDGTIDPLPSHYKLRVRASIVFIDTWLGSDYVAIMFGSTEKLKLLFGTQPNMASTNGCNSPPLKRYGVLDTGDVSHFDVLDVILFQASTCNSCPNSGCQPCGWGLPRIILLLQLCHPYCSLCYGTLKTNCTACANDTSTYPPIEYMLSGNTCDTTCLTGWFISGSNMCSPCQANCSACEGVSTNCTVCYPSFVLFPPNTSCVSSCPSKYYFNSTTGTSGQC